MHSRQLAPLLFLFPNSFTILLLFIFYEMSNLCLIDSVLCRGSLENQFLLFLLVSTSCYRDKTHKKRKEIIILAHREISIHSCLGQSLWVHGKAKHCDGECLMSKTCYVQWPTRKRMRGKLWSPNSFFKGILLEISQGCLQLFLSSWSCKHFLTQHQLVMNFQETSEVQTVMVINTWANANRI